MELIQNDDSKNENKKKLIFLMLLFNFKYHIYKFIKFEKNNIK